MRRTHWIAALGGAVVVAVAAGSVAVASTPASQHKGKTLHFDVKFVADTPIDLGEGGPSQGDEIVIHDVLLDTSGKEVGHTGGSCTISDPAVPEANCVVTYSLPAGQIATQFLNTPPARKVVAIIGGTGRYRNARGTAVVVEHGDQTGTVTIHLLG